MTTYKVIAHRNADYVCGVCQNRPGVGTVVSIDPEIGGNPWYCPTCLAKLIEDGKLVLTTAGAAAVVSITSITPFPHAELVCEECERTLNSQVVCIEPPVNNKFWYCISCLAALVNGGEATLPVATAGHRTHTLTLTDETKQCVSDKRCTGNACRLRLDEAPICMVHLTQRINSGELNIVGPLDAAITSVNNVDTSGYEVQW